MAYNNTVFTCVYQKFFKMASISFKLSCSVTPPSISICKSQLLFHVCFYPQFNTEECCIQALWTAFGLTGTQGYTQGHRAASTQSIRHDTNPNGTRNTFPLRLSSASAPPQITFSTISKVCHVEQQSLHSYCFWPFPQGPVGTITDTVVAIYSVSRVPKLYKSNYNLPPIITLKLQIQQTENHCLKHVTELVKLISSRYDVPHLWRHHHTHHCFKHWNTGL